MSALSSNLTRDEMEASSVIPTFAMIECLIYAELAGVGGEGAAGTNANLCWLSYVWARWLSFWFHDRFRGKKHSSR